MPTPPVPRETRDEIRRLKRAGVQNRVIAKKCGVSTGYVSELTGDISSQFRTKKRLRVEEAIRAGWSSRKIIATCKVTKTLIDAVLEGMQADVDPPAGPGEFPDDDVTLPPLPASDAKPLPVFEIDGAGTWGIIGDIHIPYHDHATIKRFVAECQHRKVKGILLNGDTLDSHEVAFFDVERDAKTYKQELETCKEFLAYLRARFPKTRIVWKDGNHEERAARYLLRRAPAISDVPCVNLPAFVDMHNYGLEYVTDKRLIMLGKLPVIHGHEYRGGVSTPVNAARGVFLKAKSTAMTSHFHSTSFQPEMTLKGEEIGVWSIGCACGLQPRYNPHGGKWNHGYAIVELDRDGGFAVDNRRVLRNGKVV